MTCRRARELDVEGFLMEPASAAYEAFRDHYPGCADCSAAVSEWTQMETFLRESPVGEEAGSRPAHPEPATLAAYADVTALSNDHRDRIRLHLDECAPCRLELRSIQNFVAARAAAEASPAPSVATEEVVTGMAERGDRERGGVLGRISGLLADLHERGAMLGVPAEGQAGGVAGD